MRPFIRDLIAQLFLCCIALIIVRGPILHGDIFLPLDLLPHQPPWSYSYERTTIATPFPR